MLTPKYKLGDTVWMIRYISKHHKCPTCKQIVYDKGENVVIKSDQITRINVIEEADYKEIVYALDGFLDVEEQYLYVTKQEAELKAKRGKKR